MTVPVTPPGGAARGDLALAPRPRADASAADFDAFYQAHYPGTVAAVYALTGDRAEAHDLAQEAYCRAWQRWGELSRYDNPAAWAYRVATNLARSRWRHLRVAAAHLVRQRPDDTAPPDPEHVALVAALRELPADQRQAIVLHHLVDLPVGDVAREMGVPTGTVKSWLSRGRAELAVLLADPQAGRRAPAPEVRRRGEQQRRVRRGALAGAVTAVVAVLALLGLDLFGPRGHQPVPPAESPSPSVTATPSPSGPAVPGPSLPPLGRPVGDDPIGRVDWGSATIGGVPAQQGCASGRLAFRNSGEGYVSGTAYPRTGISPDTVVYGDLTGDGRAEAVLYAYCKKDAEDSLDAEGQLLAVTRDSGGALRALGWVGIRGALFPGFWIAGGVVNVEMHPWHRGPEGHRPGMAYGYRWTGSTFAAADVSAAYPPAFPSGPGRVLDLTPVADRVHCGGLPAPTGPVRPAFDADGIAGGGDRTWTIVRGAPSNGPHLVLLDPAGRPYLLLQISCAPGGTGGAAPGDNLVVFDAAADGWRALATVPIADGEGIGSWRMEPDGRLTVSAAAEVTYTWTGLAFAR
ncbi:hypothetical protein Cs7R123_35860 [Catellatospora sp. TT07R-123]|uniref:SigE family RNA polymerase sigma factor n=1 Tax=Catellatospora sp. TT07R-123 TaxID=2733863 RepID=UPI001B2E5FB8|nr:SigE family RNA polymerase sigma factor [Catellatospora sp. TT07R-123]GHJ46244.1 hypothetical protein Cs7R123_35860 [Catellatospora sp. TT07R-123]